jgi:glycosidase
VAVLLDREDGSAARTPDALAQQVVRALATRNLVAGAPLDSSTFSTQRRTSQARLQDLAKRAQGAPLVLLVEARVIYDSVIDVKYRWSVYVKATIARTNDLGSALSQQSTFPAFLDFDHEREPEAAVAVAPQIMDQVSRLADDLIVDLNLIHAGTETPQPRPARSLAANGGAIYFVLVDRFADGDPSNNGSVDRADPQAFHGGDLQGVLQHLDELKDLGVGAVWLSPVFKTRTEKLHGHGAFHGYWVEDLTEIDPRFGGESALVQLSDELHRRGMLLYLDVVLNHVAYDAPLTKAHPEWFHHNGDIRDWNDPVQLQTYDIHGLPDLAQEREDVYQYLLKTSLHWIDRIRPDGFRLDAVKHISPQFWARYNEDIRSHTGPGFLLLGEDLEGHVSGIAETMQGGHFTSLFDFPLHFALVDVFCRSASPEKLGAVLFEDRRYPHPENLATLLDNHDLPRIASACSGRPGQVRQALTFLLATRGVPTLTYGTEVPLMGAGEPENRADMRFDGSLANFLRSQLKSRRQHADLVQLPCISILAPDAFACIKRRDAQALIIAVNHGARPFPVQLPSGTFELSDATTGSAIPETQAHPIAPGTTEVLLLQASTPAVLDAWTNAVRSPAGEAVLAMTVRGSPPLGSGDRLYLTGSGEELGDWTPEHGVPLDQAPGVTTIRLPAAGIFEAKMVIRHADGTLLWEEGRNRYFYDLARMTRRCLQWSQGDCTVT